MEFESINNIAVNYNRKADPFLESANISTCLILFEYTIFLRFVNLFSFTQIANLTPCKPALTPSPQNAPARSPHAQPTSDYPPPRGSDSESRPSTLLVPCANFCVYECCGLLKIACRGPSSTIWPKYITATRWLMRSTTAMSCEIKR